MKLLPYVVLAAVLHLGAAALVVPPPDSHRANVGPTRITLRFDLSPGPVGSERRPLPAKRSPLTAPDPTPSSLVKSPAPSAAPSPTAESLPAEAPRPVFVVEAPAGAGGGPEPSGHPAGPIATAAADDPLVLAPARLVFISTPEYPPRARRRGWEGLVMVEVRVDRFGDPSRVEVAESSGRRDLDEAARAAVAKALFQPELTTEGPRDSTVVVPVRFSLTD